MTHTWLKDIKKGINLLTFINYDTTLRKVASTRGGEWAGPCPFCGGHDRFRVQPNCPEGGRWFCRGCGEGKWHDVITYIQRRDNINFSAALQMLSCNQSTFTNIPNAPPKNTLCITQGKEPNPVWQQKAEKFVQDCEKNLWGSEGERARNWLNDRGLHNHTIRWYRLGYNPKNKNDLSAEWGVEGKRLFLPRGITIPCFEEDKIWYVTIRRPTGNQKYHKVKGSKSALFGAGNLRGSLLVLLVEGEFDCMLVDQEIGDVVGVATLGAATHQLDLTSWGYHLLPAKYILVAYDSDNTGKRGARTLLRLSARIRIINVPVLQPGDKDLTDYFFSGGNLWGWFKYKLERLELLKTLLHGVGNGNIR